MSGTPSSAALGSGNSTVSAGNAFNAITAEGPSRWPGGDPPLLRRRRPPRRRRTVRGLAEEPCGRCRPRGTAAAAAPRLARARTVGAVNRRGRYGSPSPRLHPGGSRRLPVAASGPYRTRPAGVRQMPCSAGRAPASIGIWPRVRARCVPAPEGTAARRRLRAPCFAGTGAIRRVVRAGAGHRLAGEEAATLRVDRKTRRDSVHAVPSWQVGAGGSRSGCPRESPSAWRDPQVLVAAQILLQVAVQDIGQLTDLRL